MQTRPARGGFESANSPPSVKPKLRGFPRNKLVAFGRSPGESPEFTVAPSCVRKPGDSGRICAGSLALKNRLTDGGFPMICLSLSYDCLFVLTGRFIPAHGASVGNMSHKTHCVLRGRLLLLVGAFDHRLGFFRGWRHEIWGFQRARYRHAYCWINHIRQFAFGNREKAPELSKANTRAFQPATAVLCCITSPSWKSDPHWFSAISIPGKAPNVMKWNR